MTSDAANPLENNDEMKTSVIEGTNDSSWMHHATTERGETTTNKNGRHKTTTCSSQNNKGHGTAAI